MPYDFDMTHDILFLAALKMNRETTDNNKQRYRRIKQFTITGASCINHLSFSFFHFMNQTLARVVCVKDI